MTAPPRRVLALAIAACRRPIEDRFNPPTHPACRLRLLGPDRLKHFHDQPDIDRLYRQRSEGRMDIGDERRWPLRRMLIVLPRGLMRGDVALGAVPEGHRLGRVELRCHAPCFACLDWIAAVEPRLAAFERLQPRFGEADSMGRTKPHFPQLAAFLKAEHPAFRATGAHLQKEPAAVAVIPAALGLRDRQRGQLPDRPRHRPSPSYYPS